MGLIGDCEPAPPVQGYRSEWSGLLQDWLQTTFGAGRVQLRNACLPGSHARLMLPCMDSAVEVGRIINYKINHKD